MFRFMLFTLLLALLGCTEAKSDLAQAQENESQKQAQVTAQASQPQKVTAHPSNLKEVQAALQQAISNHRIEAVQATPIAGLYEVTIDNYRVYMSGDGRYLFQGDIIDRPTSRNLTKLSVLESIDDNDTIVFPAKRKTEYTLTVFTDTDCGYCRKLHSEVPELNKNGITVRYLMYPRAGLNSQSAKTLESIWCAKNPPQALTTVKSGGTVPAKQCDNPMEEHVSLAHQLGLQGTPLLLTVLNGNPVVINGYMPADRLIESLKAGVKNGPAL